MNKQIERILICLLWLLAATLGTCFWLNTAFGFNIFSAQHWQYLAYLQASQSPVRSTFYISLMFSILISIGVLYILVRPRGIRRRRIGIGQARVGRENAHETPTLDASGDAAPIAPTPTFAPTQPAPQQMQRPRRIGITSTSGSPVQPAPAQPVFNPTPQITPQPQQPSAAPTGINFDELRDIFDAAGYTVKNSPRLGNFKPALLAIGTNESLWIGGVGIEESVLATAMQRLATVFAETLDDIQINIFGFIIAPNGGISNTDIHAFADVAELRTYMESNKNTPPSDAGEQENFNAYSEYIDTVINYMDKM